MTAVWLVSFKSPINWGSLKIHTIIRIIKRKQKYAYQKTQISGCMLRANFKNESIETMPSMSNFNNQKTRTKYFRDFASGTRRAACMQQITACDTYAGSLKGKICFNYIIIQKDYFSLEYSNSKWSPQAHHVRADPSFNWRLVEKDFDASSHLKKLSYQILLLMKNVNPYLRNWESTMPFIA